MGSKCRVVVVVVVGVEEEEDVFRMVVEVVGIPIKAVTPIVLMVSTTRRSSKRKPGNETCGEGGDIMIATNRIRSTLGEQEVPKKEESLGSSNVSN
jgi:hypothetical protein